MSPPAIRSFSYDESRNELTVVFSTGRTYVYMLVPPHVHAAMTAAPSKGGYHNAHIKDRFPFRKAPGDEARADRVSLRDALRRSAGES